MISPLLFLETAPVFVPHHDPLDHQSYPAELLFPQSFQDSIMSVLKESEKRQISSFWNGPENLCNKMLCCSKIKSSQSYKKATEPVPLILFTILMAIENNWEKLWYNMVWIISFLHPQEDLGPAYFPLVLSFNHCLADGFTTGSSCLLERQ